MGERIETECLPGGISGRSRRADGGGCPCLERWIHSRGAKRRRPSCRGCRDDRMGRAVRRAPRRARGHVVGVQRLDALRDARAVLFGLRVLPTRVVVGGRRDLRGGVCQLRAFGRAASRRDDPPAPLPVSGRGIHRIQLRLGWLVGLSWGHRFAGPPTRIGAAGGAATRFRSSRGGIPPARARPVPGRGRRFGAANDAEAPLPPDEASARCHSDRRSRAAQAGEPEAVPAPLIRIRRKAIAKF